MKMKNRPQIKKIALFLLILALGAFLRLYKLFSAPPLLHFEEAIYGYNGWSILTTGRDEFGEKFPLNFRALDDWRPPLLIYTLSIFFKIFGVADQVIRYPAVAAGILTIIVMYFLARRLLGKKYALSAMFLAAVNPGLIILSRSALDAPLALLFTMSSLLFFLTAMEKNSPLLLLLSLFPASLSLFTYQAAKMFTPLMFVLLAIIYFRPVGRLVAKNKISLTGVGLGLIAFLILLIIVLTDIRGVYRFTSISIFDQELPLKLSIFSINLNSRLGIGWADFLANRRIFFLLEGIKRYLDNYNPAFLFAPRIDLSSPYAFPNLGSFFPFEIVLLVFAAISARRFFPPAGLRLILGLLAVAALPSAFINAAPQITRVLPVIPAVILFLSPAVVHFPKKLKFLLVFLYSIFLIFLVYNLFVFLPSSGRAVFSAGYKEIVQKTEALKSNYHRVIVSNSLQKPYILFRWHARYSPALYLQRGAARTGSGLDPQDSFDKYIFRRFSPADFASSTEKALFVGLKTDFPPAAIPLEQFDCENQMFNECVWLVESHG